MQSSMGFMASPAWEQRQEAMRDSLNLPRVPCASEETREYGSWDQPDSQGPCSKVPIPGPICPVWEQDLEIHPACFLPTLLPGQ